MRLAVQELLIAPTDAANAQAACDLSAAKSGVESFIDGAAVALPTHAADDRPLKQGALSSTDKDGAEAIGLGSISTEDATAVSRSADLKQYSPGFPPATAKTGL